MKRLFVVLITCWCVILGSAAPAGALNGLTASPALKQIVIPANGQAVSFKTEVTNNTASTLTIAASAEDFTYLNQDGAIKFVDPSADGSTGAHGLAGAIHFDHELFRLRAGQSADVLVTIDQDHNLAAGGHYAAVVYHVVDPTSSGRNVVGIKPAVATLIFATTEGQGTQGVQLVTTGLGGFTISTPSRLELVFRDTGNTQTVVRGLVQLREPLGAEVARAQINVDSGMILPGATRLFSTPLNAQVNRPWMPGLYRLTVSYHYDGETVLHTYSQTVLYIDGRLLAAVAALPTLLLVLILRRYGPGRSYLMKR